MTDNTEHGREVRAEARKIPRPSRAIVAAYEEWLMEQSGSTKPPVQAAELMAILYKLDSAGLPCPRREALADAVGGAKSKYTVDAVVYTQRAEGHLELVIETVQGKTKARTGIRQERYLKLSKEAHAVGRKAERGA